VGDSQTGGEDVDARFDARTSEYEELQLGLWNKKKAVANGSKRDGQGCVQCVNMQREGEKR